MKRTMKAVFYLMMTAAIAFGAWRVYLQADKKANPPAEKKGRDALPVRVDIVRTGCVTNAIKLTGSLEAVRVVDLMPKISGRLDRLALDDGTPVWEGVTVSNGQVIAVLDHREIKARLAEANAAVKTARAALDTAKVVLKDRDRERKRMEKLFAEGSTTEQQRDLAGTAYEQAVTGLAQAEAQLVQSLAAAEVIAVNLSEAFIRAPMDGVVSAKYADPGAMVNAATRIVRIIPMDELKFLIAIPGPYLRHLSEGVTEVVLMSDALPGQSFSGVIARIHPSVDPVTRTATVEVRIANKCGQTGGWLLRPGLYAEGRIILEVKRDVVTLPADVALRRGERFLAFVAKDGRAETRDLIIGARDGNTLEIVEGLQAGEQVVVMGQHRLTEGSALLLADDDKRRKE
ncbi:MAG: efflux RND transporter periplasmic adaptor subunit [Kiritimatiellae bacterium]|nr:efflux RND transporter periplasmic adaptor subunit [Kiritimatiellia bacterium]